MNKFFLSSVASILCLTSTQAFSTPVSMGLGVGFTDPSYKGYSANYYPIPNIDFDNGIFFINGLNAGGYIYNDEIQSLSIGLNYLPLSFKPRKTNDEKLSKLDGRKATLLAEIKYDHDFDWGELSISAGVDMLNESKTVLLNANYSYTEVLWNTVAFTPSIGVNWLNHQHNNYYYGITEEESLKSGMPVYNANSALQPYAGLTTTFLLTQDWKFYVGVRVDKLTGDLKDSPMTNHSTITSGYTGLIYTF